MAEGCEAVKRGPRYWFRAMLATVPSEVGSALGDWIDQEMNYNTDTAKQVF